MRTANNQFGFDKVYLGKTLHDHIIDVHAVISKKCGWAKTNMVIGMFGYDNLAMSLAYIFEFCHDMLDIETVSKYAHIGWANNYVYWRDNKPWLNSKLYKKPNKALGDDRRNKLAKTSYRKLPEEEKLSNIAIAEYVHNLVTFKKVEFKDIIENKI